MAWCSDKVHSVSMSRSGIATMWVHDGACVRKNEGWSEHTCENVLVAKVASTNAYKMLQNLPVYYQFPMFPNVHFLLCSSGSWVEPATSQWHCKNIELLLEGLSIFRHVA